MYRTILVTLLAVSAAAQVAPHARPKPLARGARTPKSPQLYVYPANAYPPAGSYQTCTAIVNGYTPPNVSWAITSGTGGTIKATTPTSSNEPSTASLYSASTSATYVLTASAHGMTGTCTIHMQPTPTPRGDHPRFLITSAMLPTLQTHGTSANLMYNSSIKAIASTNYTNQSANGTFSAWNGTACAGGNWPTSDQSANYTEVAAFWFTKVALFDSSATVRNQYGCAARDIFLANVGYINSGKFTVSGNRAGDSALEWSLMADWLMGGGYLASTDLPGVRQYLYKIAQNQLAGQYGNVPPIGNYNSLVQFQQGDQYSATYQRAMGNNYTFARIMLMTAVALTFNDNTTDDPPLTNTCSATRYVVCPDGTAGSLHAYWNYVTGALLFLEWAHLEPSEIVMQAYNEKYSGFGSVPQCNTTATAVNGWTVNCLGDGRGGESVEGYIYGGSTTWLRRAATMWHTAGVDDPLTYGPQMSLGTSSYWDLRQVSDLIQLVGLSGFPTQASRWAFLSNGDTNTYWTYVSNNALEAAMLEGDLMQGPRTDRNSALQWLVLNSAFGMANGTAGGCSGSCGFTTQIGNDLGSTVSMEMFIAAPDNPLASLPPDPRPNLPLDWYDGGNQHIVSRDNGWTIGADTVFDEWCTTTQIDHEHQFCGAFDVYSNGEYITKGRTEFNDYNDALSLAMYKNAETMLQFPGQTWCQFSPYCQYWQNATYGGQFYHGYEAGPSPVLYSQQPNYVAAIDNATNSYNGAWGTYANFNAVTEQSRSLIYARPLQTVVYYDRGATGTNAWSKTNSLMTTGAVTVTGNSAAWPTPSGTQKAVFTSLLPAGATVSAPKLPIYTTVTAPHSSLNSATTMQATCVATLGDGTTQDVTAATPTVWASDNTYVFTVSSSGLVTPVAAGGANVVCDYLGVHTQVPVNIVSGSSSGSVNGANQDQTADWELHGWIKVDAGNTPKTRFLSSVQWGASTFTPKTVSLVQSSAGQAFDGALVGTTLYLFMQNPATFSGTTYPASAATTQYIADLAPNTSYPISGAGAPTTGTSDSAGVLTFAASGSGSITVGAGAPPPVVTTYVLLNWTPSTTPGATHSVYRIPITGSCPTDTASYGTPIATAITAATYSDMSTLASGNYCYIVVAVANGLSSAPSNPAPLNITAASPPAPVTGLTATLTSGRKHAPANRNHPVSRVHPRATHRPNP